MIGSANPSAASGKSDPLLGELLVWSQAAAYQFRRTDVLHLCTGQFDNHFKQMENAIRIYDSSVHLFLWTGIIFMH